MARTIVSPDEVANYVNVRATNYPSEKVDKLHSNLALPSYVHGYSLAIEYMYKWFESKFEEGFFKGGIYVDGKHVLDDYKKFSKNVIKGQNPRARIEPRVEYDYDREMIDTYLAPVNIYLNKSKFNESFFKDYDRDMFLGMEMKALRMEFNFKVRVNTRSQQLDTYNRMNLYFRIGSTMQDHISVDFHIPKDIILNIADKAGFDIKNGEIVEIIPFLNYLNKHSDLPFLFKIRAINQKSEFFIRITGLYTHINCTDKLQMDDGERDGKLDFNFHVEMRAVLTIPIPSFYYFFAGSELRMNIATKESSNAIALYSIEALEIPNVDNNGWIRAAIVDYMTDIGDTSMDLSSIFTGNNSLARAIEHTLTNSVSPYKFINIVIYRGDDVARLLPITMDWRTRIAHFKEIFEREEVLHIAVYYDRQYINQLDIELDNLNNQRLKSV